jgi:streptogramin lyase
MAPQGLLTDYERGTAMTRNLPIRRSPFRNSHIFVLLLTLAGLSVGCGTVPIGNPSPPSASAIKGTVRIFTLPIAGSNPGAITVGPDGNLWFTEVTATTNGPISKIGRITPSGTISDIPSSTLHGNLSSITVGPDGNIWFIDGGLSQGGKIGRITPTGTITEFPLPASNSDPSSITAGPDGNLWFTYGGFTQNGKIERITPMGTITEFPLPSSIAPGSITAGPDGSLWFTVTIIDPKTIAGPGQSGQIGRITTTGEFSTYQLQSDSKADSITSGPDHNIWFSEEVLNNRSLSSKIGRITPAGAITEFTLPMGNPNGLNGGTVGITAGKDGALWFTDAANNTIGRITTNGTISQFTLPTPQSAPESITSGPSGTLWFTEPGLNGQTGKIGRLTLA